MTERFERDETIIIEVDIKTAAGVLTDPDSIVIYIIDSAGTTKVDGVAMTKDGVGEYHYDHTPGATDVLGLWKVRFKAVSGTRTSIADTEFYLIEGVM